MQTLDARPVDQIVNTVRYPLSDPASTEWRNAVATAQEELRCTGCCVLADFVREPLVEELRRECAALAPAAYYDVETVNVYNAAPDSGYPDDHPVRIAMERGNAFVARDQIPENDIIHRLYVSERFQRFVAACFSLPEIHELADPLAGLCLNVVTPGRSHPWHFDTNEFAVSLLTQAPEAGGALEYCPNIRTAESENVDSVRDVLAGRGGRLIRRRVPRPGDLQLFRGRHSLHRVTTVRGDRERHSAIFAYSERPGVISTVARTRQLFGRVTRAHVAAEGRTVRGDSLLD